MTGFVTILCHSRVSVEELIRVQHLIFGHTLGGRASVTIQHVVLFTLKKGVDIDDERVQEAARFSASHADYVDEIETWRTGFDVSRRSLSADFLVLGTFSDPGAVARYLDHPHHREGVSLWRDLADWTVADLVL